MFAVIFEVQPKPERFAEYLEIAKALRPKLEQIEGFIANDRFASKRTEGRLLSLSIWRDEKAIVRWRTVGAHHAAQTKGRFEIFADYHLRVGEIIKDTQPPEGEIPSPYRRDITEVGQAKAVSVSELLQSANEASPADFGLPELGRDGLLDCEMFESIYHPGKFLLLASWQDENAAEQWLAQSRPAASVRHRIVRILRDYGLFDRREAPQYFPPVQKT
ncbi:MAG: antibiotic biosynthesis monooxygenase [Acetobacteraceae bacterium]|nr:antibiotic biosynthesis monooxygenase [Acetobacteraceae bacterium]